MAQVSESQWEDHDHDAVVHTHSHYHVTHNFREMTGGFEHLASEHEHDHDHAPLQHRHFPHQDLDGEHGGEAHVHDHVQPARELDDSRGKKAEADEGNKKAPAKRSKSTSRSK